MIYKCYVKRWLDVIFSIFLLIALTPIFLCLIVIIKLSIPGNIFFRQARVGINGKIFQIYKFKTMLESYDVDGNLLPDVLRITPMGKCLRQLSLDELPTLLNVLKGDMSFVGPRPLLVEYLAYYNDYQHQRHLVIPGITGWAQINGRNALTWDEKFDFDIWYVQHQHFVLDLKILSLTFLKIFNPKYFNNKEHAIMPKFLGNSLKKMD